MAAAATTPATARVVALWATVASKVAVLSRAAVVSKAAVGWWRRDERHLFNAPIRIRLSVARRRGAARPAHRNWPHRECVRTAVQERTFFEPCPA